MKARQIRLISLLCLGLVLAVDLIHAILNAIYRPFQGAIDNAMHLVLTVSPLAYGATGVCLAYGLLNRLRRKSFVLNPLVLILVLAAELAFTLLVAPRTGSSSYRPLFPDFLSGLILAGLTLGTAKPYLDSRLVRIVLSFLICLWLAGTLISDLLWHSEGTERGTGPLWHIPVLSNVLVGFVFLVVTAGDPQFFLNMFGVDLPAINLAVGIVLVLLIGWHLSRTHRGDYLRLISVVLSIGFVMFKVTEWAQFFVD